MTENTKLIASLFAIFSVVAFIILGVWFIFSLPDTVVQPIVYNHKLHIENAGLECKDCHKYVEKMASATIPNISICQDCHEEDPFSDSPEEAKLLKYINEKQQIPWEQIYTVPDHVYFSHRRHVVLGELECSKCHGNVEEQTKPAPHQIVSVSMNNCLDCHKQHKITTDCLSCHR